MNDFNELDEMARTYAPSTGLMPGPEVLAEGTYSVEILKAELVRTPRTGDIILRWVCQVIEGPRAGLKFDRPQFLSTPVQLDILGGDMCKLGVDAEKWGKRGKPWSQELLEALPSIIGKRFIGQRKDGREQADGRPGFPNFNVVSVINYGGPAKSNQPAQPPPVDIPLYAMPDDQIPF